VTVKAIDVALWFINQGLDNPSNTYDGNMKLQKLLYFAQLIYLAKYGDLLFEEPIYAYKNGAVVEKVRLTYKNHYELLANEAYNSSFDSLNEEAQYIKTITFSWNSNAIRRRLVDNTFYVKCR